MMRKKVFTYLVIALLSLVYAVNYQVFILPNHFAPAGLNGICVMIQYLFGINIGYLSLIINIPLAIAVYFLVSKPLAVRAMTFNGLLSIFLILFEYVDISAFVYATETGTSALLGPLVGGIIGGWAGTVLIRCGAHFGGTDFISSLIRKYYPNINFFWISFTLNAVVAVASYFVYGFQLEPVLLCIIYCFTLSVVLDSLGKSGRAAVRFEIITDDPETISRAIIDNLHHSATLIPAKGMYRGKDTNVLICVVNKTQVAAVSAIVRSVPNTFAVMSQVNEVMGNFQHLDAHNNPEKNYLDSTDTKIH